MATNKLRFGTETPTKLYLGATEVTKAYMGETLVYEKSSSSGEMWIINENPTINTTIDFPNDFTVEVNGTTYIGGQIFYVLIPIPNRIENKIIRFNNPSIDVFTNGVWVSNEYRIWNIKSEIPSDILAWLQANGVKQ